MIAIRLEPWNGGTREGWASGKPDIQVVHLSLETSHFKLLQFYTRLPITRRVAGIGTEKWIAPRSEITVSPCPDAGKENLRAGRFWVLDCCTNKNIMRVSDGLIPTIPESLVPVGSGWQRQGRRLCRWRMGPTIGNPSKLRRVAAACRCHPMMRWSSVIGTRLPLNSDHTQHPRACDVTGVADHGCRLLSRRSATVAAKAPGWVGNRKYSAKRHGRNRHTSRYVGVDGYLPSRTAG